jgi:hypothetical protein
MLGIVLNSGQYNVGNSVKQQSVHLVGNSVKQQSVQ